jgi:integrase
MRGSIRRRGKNSFEIQIELDRVGSQRRRRFISFKGSYRDAQRELARLLTQADSGTLPDPTQATIGEYLRQWIGSALNLSPKTKERYAELIERQVLPHIGELKLQKLRPEHLEQWHAKLLATGLSARTVGHAHRCLSAALTRAVQNGTLARNVAAIRKPPAAEDREIEILTPDQVSTVLTALKDHALHPVTALAVASGMRRGELLGLEWSDIDLDRAVLRVERSLEETRQGVRTKPPKTRRSRRNIPLPPEAIAMLREHRKRQIELRLALGQGGQPRLVFSTIEGDHLSPDNLSRDWRRICRQKKLPLIGFHALRHTFASILIRQGVDILRVSRLLGHSRASTTLDRYGHLIEGSDADAVKAIEGVLKK